MLRRIGVLIRCKEKQDNGEIYEIPNYFSLNISQDNDIRLEHSAHNIDRQGGQRAHSILLNARSPTDYCCGKAISITYYESVYL